MKIDGKTLSELGLILLQDHDHPLLSETNDYTVSIPGRHGFLDYGADLGAKVFNIPLLIKEAENRQELSFAIRKLLPVFIDAKGNPKTVKIQFDYEPDVFYMARYYGSLPIDRLMRTGRFTLPLIAVDPFKSFVESTEDIKWDSDIPFNSDVPIAAQYSFTVTSPQTLERVDNFGTLDIRPLIEISGSTSSLTLSANGKSFSFGSFSNSTIIVDGENYAVLKNGTNALSSMTGDFVELLVGENDVTVSGTGLNVTITFKFYNKYI